MPTMTVIQLPRGALPNSAGILKAVENAMTGTAKDIKVDFGVTVQTWKEKPEFVIEKDTLERRIFTDNDIYRFVSRGTSIRYATMSPDFAPKTRNRFIGSNKGKGGVVFISRKFPKPGIKAREFEQVIQEKWQKEFPVNVQRAIDAELARTTKR